MTDEPAPQKPQQCAWPDSRTPPATGRSMILQELDQAPTVTPVEDANRGLQLSVPHTTTYERATCNRRISHRCKGAVNGGLDGRHDAAGVDCILGEAVYFALRALHSRAATSEARNLVHPAQGL